MEVDGEMDTKPGGEKGKGNEIGEKLFCGPGIFFFSIWPYYSRYGMSFRDAVLNLLADGNFPPTVRKSTGSGCRQISPNCVRIYYALVFNEMCSFTLGMLGISGLVV
jgi:hypothetical protein